MRGEEEVKGEKKDTEMEGRERVWMEGKKVLIAIFYGRANWKGQTGKGKLERGNRE